ncbi:leucine-rich repeat domain-containing protein [Microcoleus sp. herbarium5]|uniref:leucine-rich repeat domain-containing protein n=1 Tax=Microcoleus sp. herbarium5 TaxID=3055434 RepID=UPI002FD04BA2
MSEKQPNEPMSFSSFADWCRHIDSLSVSARHTVEVLLEKAGTDDAQAADRILSSMTELDLGDNKITDISFLGSLTNLTTLNLGGNEINDISSLGWLTNLTTLNLYNNPITDISSLGSLTNLTTLELSYNKITEISFLGSLTNLTTLNLSFNKITEISFLGSLTNLTTLHLNNNQITDISFLGSLTNLTKLNLSGNRITEISFLGSLTNLTELRLNDNQIIEISALRSLTNLTTLGLDHNQITEISALRSLTNLRTLFLDYNQITEISALRSLTNLITLYLDYNQITKLSVLGELAQKHLTLSTKPIDGEKATAAVKVAYAAIGLEEPEVIVCSSPRDAYLQIFNLPKRDHSLHWSNEGHWNRLGEKLDWKWIWMSPSIVREFASPGVWKYELDCMTTSESESDSTLRGLMYELVNEYERSEQTKGNVFPYHLLFLKYPETPTDLLKEIYLTELYISSLGINLSERSQEILRCQKLLFEECGWIFPFEKICTVCDRPRHLRFDSQNRLHAEAEPAIEFADGWNLALLS